MSPEGSITRWLDLLQAGNSDAVQVLWERYFHRLVGLARKKLKDAPRRAADEEDVALSAFDSFCRHAEAGRFPQLADRDSLWRILVVITARKASHLVRDEARQKRGGGAVVRSQADAAATEPPILEQMLSREPTPELAACMAEEYRQLLDALADKELEAVVICRMEGYTVEEIAAKLGYAPRSIKRKLQLVRSLWEKELDS
jgi:DNA-directed RNA polymerase specialized sigma24 family protein